MSELENKRSRKWSLTIHENDEALKLLEPLSKSDPKAKNGLKIAYICHNRDKNEDGSIKLIHWHCILEFENARTFKAMKNAYGGAHIEIPNNYDATIQYLIHKNDPNKAQYDVSEVITNDAEWLKGHINAELKKTQEQQEIELIQNILHDKYESFFELIVSYDFDMTFLQRRKSVIDELFRGLQERKLREKTKAIDDKNPNERILKSPSERGERE